MNLEIIEPGFSTTVQDLGRFGWQSIGFGCAGAADRRALRVANALVGNSPNTAALECVLVGPKLRVNADTTVCVTGADAQVSVNGIAQPRDAALALKAGSVISIGPAKRGQYSYITFHGGIDVPLVMGSASTSTRFDVGGFKGRRLKQADTLKINNTDLQAELQDLQDHPGAIALGEDAYYGWHTDGSYCDCLTIRVVMADAHLFSADTISRFLMGPYEVDVASDRMGIRLKGPHVAPLVSGGIVSEGIALGTIQVPDNGQPIVMAADHQTTGGYAKIATVASVDMPRLVQCHPGQHIKFERIGVLEAQALLKRDISYLCQLRQRYELL